MIIPLDSLFACSGEVFFFPDSQTQPEGSTSPYLLQLFGLAVMLVFHRITPIPYPYSLPRQVPDVQTMEDNPG
jgi:hypothetical protein